MANGDWVGTPADDLNCYAVELDHQRGIEYVHAQHMQVDGRAVVFALGELFDRVIVAAYGPAGWATAIRLDRCIHPKGDDECDEDCDCDDDGEVA